MCNIWVTSLACNQSRAPVLAPVTACRASVHAPSLPFKTRMCLTHTCFCTPPCILPCRSTTSSSRSTTAATTARGPATSRVVTAWGVGRSLGQVRPAHSVRAAARSCAQAACAQESRWRPSTTHVSTHSRNRYAVAAAVAGWWC
jgi:hypothetical protein